MRSGTRVLARLIRAARSYDVIVAGLEWAPTFFATLAAKLASRPVIGTVHTDLHEYSAIEGVPVFWWPAMRAALTHCSGVIAVSDHVAASVERLGVQPDHITVIPNPGPGWNLRPWPTGAKMHLLTVGGLRASKGVDVAVAGAALLQDIDFEWTFVGDGPMRTDLEAQAGRLGCADRLRFVGFQRGLRSFYEDAHLFVLPSRIEGDPLALLEANAAGVPTVATRCSTAVIENVQRTSGVLVPPGDPEALAAGIRRMLGDHELLLKSGQRAHELASERRPAVVAAQYQAALERAVGPPGGA